MYLRRARCRLVVSALVLATTRLVILPASAGAQQEEIARKVKARVQPGYPELARRMNIVGLVRVQVVVAQDGSVKSTKVVGGHPLLATAAMR